MPTLTASPRALAAAVQRGLDLPSEAAEPSPRRGVTLAEAKPHDVVLVEPDPAEPSNKQRKRVEFLELQRQARERVYPTLHVRSPDMQRRPGRRRAFVSYETKSPPATWRAPRQKRRDGVFGETFKRSRRRNICCRARKVMPAWTLMPL